MTSKTEIIERLIQGPTTVKFKKKDGEIRTMKCTLSSAIVPKYERKTVAETNQAERERKVNDNIVAVWDIEKDSWRSFDINSVIEFQ